MQAVTTHLSFYSNFGAELPASLGTKGGTKNGTKERFDTLYIVIDNNKCNSRYIIKKSYSKGKYYCDLCRCNCLNTVETILKLSVER